MSKPTVISLYSGAGGLDFGFEAAGFRTSVAVDSDAACCEFIRRNRRPWKVFEGDIHDCTPRELVSAAQLRAKQADVLIGGPPCQPFSKSGYWASGDTARLQDPRASTLGAYLRVLEYARPKAFLLENVRGLAYEKKSEGIDFLLDGIRRINERAGTRYQVSFATLNAADYGVPQLRERVFLVGARNGTEFQFPKATHTSSDEPGLFLEPHRTAWDALGEQGDDTLEGNDLSVGGKWGALLPTIPEGENYLWHTARGGGNELFGWRRRYWNFLLKLAKDRPSWTIQAQPGTATGPFHWDNRRLSARELGRLQTFPENLDFDCSIAEAQKMLGNAVPSLVAEVLAQEIQIQILGTRKRRRKPSLLPPRRGPSPPPKKPEEMPEIYLPLIGSHKAHPGTGRGYSGSGRRAR